MWWFLLTDVACGLLVGVFAITFLAMGVPWLVEKFDPPMNRD